MQWCAGKRVWLAEYGSDGGATGHIALLTDAGIIKDNQKTGVVPPLDLEPPVHVFVIGKGCLDVLRLEFFGEASQKEDACDGCGQSRERGCHCWDELADVANAAGSGDGR